MSRGVYRSIYTRLFDDADYQRLSARARHVLLTARLCEQVGPGAIFRYYPEVLARQVGCTLAQVRGALDELDAAGWICRDAHVLWVRNGLRYEPSGGLRNPNHRKAVQRWLEDLPSSPVVSSFCRYYEIDMPSRPHPDAIETPSTNHRDQRNQEQEQEQINPPYPPLGGSNGIRMASAAEATEAREVLAWLNEKAGARFEPVESNLKLIRARLHEGRPAWLLKKLVAVKARQWPPGHEMHAYLRPATLFNATKCAQYIGQLPPEIREEPA